MEYNINDFVNQLRENMYNLFPYEDEEDKIMKHVIGNFGRIKNPKPLHIRDVAFMDNPIERVSDNLITFDIGNDFAEREYPYYHILEDAPVIRKKDKGTDRSRGSQAKVEDLSARDYGIVSFTGKTFTKEYTRNIRGKRRSIIDKSTRYVDGKKINRGANSYENVHYHYIEKMMSKINPFLADEFGLKLKRVEDTGLAEEYVMDMYDLPSIDSDTVSSFVEMLFV